MLYKLVSLREGLRTVAEAGEDSSAALGVSTDADVTVEDRLEATVAFVFWIV